MSRDYQPRTTPLIPVGHDCWIAVSRVKNPDIHRASNGEDGPTVDQQIEWLLRAITAPGADCSQRHDDLISLAELVIEARGNKVPVGDRGAYTWDGTESFGYGVTPIDSDTHDLDCKTCGDAKVYDKGGHDADFDRHPYEMCQGTCDVHDGIHDFVNGPHYCVGWRGYHPEEIADLNAR
jgi:hypothetical protein